MAQVRWRCPQRLGSSKRENFGNRELVVRWQLSTEEAKGWGRSSNTRGKDYCNWPERLANVEEEEKAVASAITVGHNRARLAAEMWECQRARCWGQHSTFCRLQSTAWRLEPGRLSKGYTSRTACLPQTIPGEGGCFLFFYFIISAVGCQSQLADPPPQKRLCVCEARPPLGGGWAQSQIDGAEWQPGRDGGMRWLLRSGKYQRKETAGKATPSSIGERNSI